MKKYQLGKPSVISRCVYLIGIISAHCNHYSKNRKF